MTYPNMLLTNNRKNNMEASDMPQGNDHHNLSGGDILKENDNLDPPIDRSSKSGKHDELDEGNKSKDHEWCTMSNCEVLITHKRMRNLEEDEDEDEAPQENDHPNPPGGDNPQENVYPDPPVDLATDTASNTSDKQEEVAEGNES